MQAVTYCSVADRFPFIRKPAEQSRFPKNAAALRRIDQPAVYGRFAALQIPEEIELDEFLLDRGAARLHAIEEFSAFLHRTHRSVAVDVRSGSAGAHPFFQQA